ncbi:MAG: hypothetical protein ACO36I_03240 [Candidatus Latescibacterota bacterium]
MTDRKTLAEAFQRILKIADRNHLDLPFKNNNQLRAKYFPGAGPQIGRKKLTDAYIKEFTSAHPNEKLLQHATFPWIHGYDASMAQILEDLKQNQDNPVETLPADRQQDIEKKFTKVGAEEINAFWTIYYAADNAYRKDVINMLVDVKPIEMAPTPPKIHPTQNPPQTSQPTEIPLPSANQAAYALFGALIFFVPSLILVGVQYWRLPQESHWIVVSIAAFLGLITLAFLIDFLRKRNT